MDSWLYTNSTLPNVIDLIRARRKRSSPDSFKPDGLVCFCGVQGSGKTLSATLYARKLMDTYPKALCVTNLSLNLDMWDKDRVFQYDGVKQLHDLQNGENGVIYLLDEIQLEFNSLESKQMSIPIFEAVCQQRKQRKTIIGTTQVFGRLAKPFREQFRKVVLCDNFKGLIFRQRIYTAENVAYEDDVRTELTPKDTCYYIPSPRDFDSYDTLEVIRRVRDGGIFNG